MNVFHRYTLRTLKKNKTRTAVTIVGILLSMAMFTAVTEAIYSGFYFLAASERAGVGAFHLFFDRLSYEEAQNISRQEQVRASALMQTVGWAQIENDGNVSLLQINAQTNVTDLVVLPLLAGRLPEKENELVLPVSLLQSQGDDVYALIGRTLRLQVGVRTDERGDPLPDDAPFDPTGVQIVQTVEKTYTVVGICEVPHAFLHFSGFDHAAFTYGTGSGACRVFIELKNPRTIRSFEALAGEGVPVVEHTDLLRYTGVFGRGNVAQTAYGMGAILMILIAVGSISLIYNSFSISVSERTKEIGILKSVGATRKQIRRSVGFEAFALSLVGIPLGALVGCVGIGLTFFLLSESFSMIFGSAAHGVSLRLVLHAPSLLLAAGVCLATTLLSAAIPALRAVRISPIESIRQNRDVFLRRKKSGTARLTVRLFGFPGLMAKKNFRRNRKRYRTVTWSLAMSVILFISSSSFTSYLTGTVAATSSDSISADVAAFAEKIDDPERTLRAIKDIEGVTDACCVSSFYLLTEVNERDLSYEYLQWMNEPGQKAGQSKVGLTLTFIDEETFRGLCRKSGVPEKEYTDPASPKALLYNRDSHHFHTSNGSKWVTTNPFRQSSLPLEIQAYSTGKKGYVLYDYEEDENGGMLYVYYSETYLESQNEPDRSQALILSAEEAQTRTTVALGAICPEVPMLMQPGRLAALYPYSALDAVMGQLRQKTDLVFGYAEFGVKTADHERVTEALKEMPEFKNATDVAAGYESTRRLISVVNVFSYGFIVLISMIAAANVFNTISTGVHLRRREFAVLQSIGLDKKGFYRMMNYECIVYGLRALLIGLPVSAAITFFIWYTSGISNQTAFYLPVNSVLIAVGSVFFVVFLSMFFAAGKIRKDNPIDAMKNETL